LFCFVFSSRALARATGLKPGALGGPERPAATYCEAIYINLSRAIDARTTLSPRARRVKLCSKPFRSSTRAPSSTLWSSSSSATLAAPANSPGGMPPRALSLSRELEKYGSEKGEGKRRATSRWHPSGWKRKLWLARGEKKKLSSYFISFLPLSFLLGSPDARDGVRDLVAVAERHDQVGAALARVLEVRPGALGVLLEEARVNLGVLVLEVPRVVP